MFTKDFVEAYKRDYQLKPSVPIIFNKEYAFEVGKLDFLSLEIALRSSKGSAAQITINVMLPQESSV